MNTLLSQHVSPPVDQSAPASSDETFLSSQAEADQVNILLVDDAPANLLALESLLACPGRKLVKASSGREALHWVLRQDFAIILMDVRMPDMDGLETAELIHQRNRSRHTPIIFLTAHEPDHAQLGKGYSLGAFDYLFKPIMPDVLRAKVGAFEQIFRRTQELKRHAEVLRRLEQEQHEREIAEVNKRWEAECMRKQIQVAREIQQRFFPVAPLPLPGFDISGASYAAEAIGGDYFDYLPLRDGSLGVVIGDVSGHGYGPALVMAELRAYLRAFVMTQADISEVVSLVNAALLTDGFEDRFATLFVAQLYPGSRTVKSVSAGHTAAHLFDAAGEAKLALVSTNFPLGVMPNVRYATGPEFTLEPGEGLLIITDGIMESHVGDNELFGVERTLQTVRNCWNQPARQIVDTLCSAARAFNKGAGQSDDMTAIVIKAV